MIKERLAGIGFDAFASTPEELAAFVREEVCSRLAFLGIELDAGANTSARPDATVSTPASSVRVVVLEAREDLVAARAARTLV
mgnify:CR=1 FL=1